MKLLYLRRILKGVLNHPLNKNKKISALIKFFTFQFYSEFFKKSIIFNWINESKLEINKGDVGLTGNYYCGVFDFNQVFFLLFSANESDKFIDIGSNLGSYSIAAAKVKGLNTYTIEPVKETFNRLKKIIALNELDTKINLIQLAISDYEGTAQFYNSRDSMNAFAEKNSSEVTETVGVQKLDNLFSGMGNLILKIDTEGHELRVLNGAKKLLAEGYVKSIIIENNQDSLEIHELLVTYGFTSVAFNPLTREVNKLSHPNLFEDSIYVKDFNSTKVSISENKNEYFVHHIKNYV